LSADCSFFAVVYTAINCSEVKAALIWYSTPDSFTLEEHGFDTPSGGASEMKFNWKCEGHQSKRVKLKHRFRFFKPMFPLLWEDYNTRLPGLKEDEVPSQYVIPSRMLVRDAWVVKNARQDSLRDEIVSEHGAIGTAAHTKWHSAFPPLTKQDHMFMHAYKNAHWFFPPSNDVEEDTDDDVDAADAKDIDNQVQEEAEEAEMQVDDKNQGSEEGSDKGDDDDEVGEACDDKDDGGRKAFNAQYLALLNTEELMCLDANLYDATHLDKEDEVKYSQGMDEEAKRVAELEADLLKVRDCLARRDALLSVSVHYRNVC